MQVQHQGSTCAMGSCPVGRHCATWTEATWRAAPRKQRKAQLRACSPTIDHGAMLCKPACCPAAAVAICRYMGLLGADASCRACASVLHVPYKCPCLIQTHRTVAQYLVSIWSLSSRYLVCASGNAAVQHTTKHVFLLA